MTVAQDKRGARISSAAVKAKTGKGWYQWFSVLDKAGAPGLAHIEIAELLRREHQVPSWWAQVVTVGYEQERGMRALHQKPSGFEASAGRTLSVPAEVL